MLEELSKVTKEESQLSQLTKICHKLFIITSGAYLQ